MRENEAQYRMAANTWYKAVEKAGGMYKAGYSTSTSGEKFQIKEFDDGRKYVFVDTDQKQFEGLDGEELRKKVKEVIDARFTGTILGYKEEKPIVETKRGASEYAYSKTKKTYSDERKAKFKASTELQNLLESGQYAGHRTYEEVKERHPEAVGGFDYYKTIFTFDNKTFFSGIINVMNQKRVRTFYDMTKIKSADLIGIHRDSYEPRGRIEVSTYDNNISSSDKKGNKFQLSDPVEETKNLIAVRNVDQSALSSMLELEGMPSPSIAITKADIGHTQFGDVTFIFGKDTIDPWQDDRNLVFDADAWTPTFNNSTLTVERDIKTEKLDNINGKLHAFLRNHSGNTFNDTKLDKYNFEDALKNKNYNLTDLADDSYDLKLMYLEDKVGESYKIPNHIETEPYIEGLSAEETAKLAERLKDTALNFTFDNFAQKKSIS